MCPDDSFSVYARSLNVRLKSCIGSQLHIMSLISYSSRATFRIFAALFLDPRKREDTLGSSPALTFNTCL